MFNGTNFAASESIIELQFLGVLLGLQFETHEGTSLFKVRRTIPYFGDVVVTGFGDMRGARVIYDGDKP